MAELGIMLREGLGIDSDWDAGTELLLRAAELGNEVAQKKLEQGSPDRVEKE